MWAEGITSLRKIPPGIQSPLTFGQLLRLLLDGQRVASILLLTHLAGNILLAPAPDPISRTAANQFSWACRMALAQQKGTRMPVTHQTKRCSGGKDLRGAGIRNDAEGPNPSQSIS